MATSEKPGRIIAKRPKSEIVERFTADCSTGASPPPRYFHFDFTATLVKAGETRGKETRKRRNENKGVFYGSIVPASRGAEIVFDPPLSPKRSGAAIDIVLVSRSRSPRAAGKILARPELRIRDPRVQRTLLDTVHGFEKFYYRFTIFPVRVV